MTDLADLDMKIAKLREMLKPLLAARRRLVNRDYQKRYNQTESGQARKAKWAAENKDRRRASEERRRDRKRAYEARPEVKLRRKVQKCTRGPVIARGVGGADNSPGLGADRY